jgi:hypothetical protein
MKHERGFPAASVARCRRRQPPAQQARLAEAGYPKFLFRLTVVRGVRLELPDTPRRHD